MCAMSISCKTSATGKRSSEQDLGGQHCGLRHHAVQQRVTATFRQRDGHTLHVRKAIVAEPDLRQIYDALQIDPAPGGIRKYLA
jgi:hypothetical protein